MTPLFLFDIQPSTSQFDLLQSFGVVQSQAWSWGYERIKPEGIQELFALGYFTGDRNVEIINVPIEVSNGPRCLRDYFSSFLRLALTTKDVALKLAKFSPCVIAINLMPFHLGTTLVDKIIQGVVDGLLGSLERGTAQLVFLARNVDWFAKSNSLKELTGPDSLWEAIRVIDYRGYNIAIEGDGSVAFPIIPRSVFQRVLKLEDQQFYNLLVYGTNSYIGHFALEYSHTRTHYDFYEFVKRDAVAEHLNAAFTEFIQDYSTVFLIGEGLEHAPVNHLAYYFMHENAEKVSGYLPRFEEDFTRPETRQSVTEAKGTIILTDIVNSGSTVKRVLAELNGLNLTSDRIRVFSIACMNNSPSGTIEGCKFRPVVRIRRDYYKSGEGDCLLCKLHQPKRVVNNAKDFYYVDKDQFTPLDFWEMVKESNALEKSGVDSQGRKFLFRVDTVGIFKKYRKWLSNAVRAKLNFEIPGCKPDNVCTVEEKGGISFAKLVIEALGLPQDCLVAIPRDILERTTPSSHPPLSPNPFRSPEAEVLLADDGMNTGDTMRKLIQFCRTAQKRILGGIVFDNRLTDEQMRAIEEKAWSKRILSIYNWPSGPVEVTWYD